MHDIDLILTLTGGLAAALIFGYITHLLRLSPIVGYLLAGIVVGPHTPGYIANQHMAEQFAEVGVILLMFGVGLHFHIEELLAVRRIAIPGALVQSLVATLLGVAVAHHFGWSWRGGIVFGLAISVASTVVLTRVLADNRDLHTATGHIAVGWLVVEDLFTVLILVVLPAVFGSSAGGPMRIALTLVIATLKVAALVFLTFFLGSRAIPKFLARIAATKSRELFTLTVLVIALGIAVGSAKVFGVSMALGAFLAGMVVGRSEFSLRAASEALPMRDAFAVLFFVSVGMLLDPRQLWNEPGMVALTVAIILIAKPLAALAIALILGYPLNVTLRVAASLSQIGEFSFILAALGKDLGILPAAATNTLVAASIISITINPMLYRLTCSTARWMPRLRAANAAPASSDADRPHGKFRAVVVGYGPVGQTVTRLLRDNGIEPSIIEMNLETTRRLLAEKVPAVYGDASHRETLKAAGVETAANLILTASGLSPGQEIIRQARELNPAIRIVARTSYVRELAALRQAGADAVFSGEGEVALAVAELLLRNLGATPEQIDRERERVRAELLGS